MSIWIAIAAIATGALAAAMRAEVPCDHRPYAHIDNRTGLIFYTCRCGER